MAHQLEQPILPTQGLSDREALSRYSQLARLLDQAFRVPGTRLRFGLDPILGLLPGAGDLITAMLGAYGVVIARQLGAPSSIQARMMLNLAVDAMAGAVPLFGDLFDFAFKAHTRNLALLERWLEKPHQARRSSALILVIGVVALLGIVIGAVWLAVIGVSALYALVSR